MTLDLSTYRLPLRSTLSGKHHLPTQLGCCAHTFCSLIYLLIIAFLIAMMNFNLRVGTGLNHNLNLHSLLGIRFAVPFACCEYHHESEGCSHRPTLTVTIRLLHELDLLVRLACLPSSLLALLRSWRVLVILDVKFSRHGCTRPGG